MNELTAKINTEELQEKANEYAQKGAIETIKDFYTGYNSPYKKALEASLENRGVDHAFSLPDIAVAINENISQEIDKIANTAIAKTFIPLVSNLLTRAEPSAKFSDILKKFISKSDYKYNNDLSQDDFSVEINREGGSFMNLTIAVEGRDYRLGFSDFDGRNKNINNREWTIYSLPLLNAVNSHNQTMKVYVDNRVKIEVPFTSNLLNDPFTAYIASFVMAETRITFDVLDFEESFFPDRHQCEC